MRISGQVAWAAAARGGRHLFAPSTPRAAVAARGGVLPPLRLLQIVGGDATSGVTGAERVAQTLVAGLDPQRFVHCIAYPSAGTLHAWFHTRVESVLSELPERRFDPSWVRTLWRFLRDRSVDVVLSHGMRYDFLAALACRSAQVPHLVSRPAPLAGEVMSRSRQLLYGLVDTWTLRACTGVVTVSAASRARMRATQRLGEDRFTIIPNGVDVPEVGAAERAAARRSLGASEEDFLVGAAGRLVVGKDFHRLIRVAAGLRPPDGRTLAVALLGDGPEREALRRQADVSGVHLALPGYVAAPHAFMAAFDVAVLPSRAEGLPLVVLESMALGVPTVATAVGGIPEIIVDGECGLLVPVDDDAALARALQQLLDSAALRSRLGAAAARRVRTDFGLQTMIERFDALLWRTAGRGTGKGQAS